MRKITEPWRDPINDPPKVNDVVFFFDMKDDLYIGGLDDDLQWVDDGRDEKIQNDTVEGWMPVPPRRK